MSKSTKKESMGDTWRTPTEVFNTLNKEFEFVADMASSQENALCGIYFTEEDDSLAVSWDMTIRVGCGVPFSDRAYVWCNPPYSSPTPWIKKALEAQKDGLGVVMLLNNDPSVGWFAEALKGASEIRHIVADETPDSGRGYASGRLAFLNDDGNAINGNNKPQVILVFNPFKIGANVTSYIPKSELYK